MALSDFRVTVGSYIIGQITGAGVRVTMTNLTGAKGFTSKPRSIAYEGAAGSYVPPAEQQARLIGIEFDIVKDRQSVAAIMTEFEAAATAFSSASPITLTLAYGTATDVYTCGEPSLIEDFSQLHVGRVRCRGTLLAGDPVAA